LHLVGYLYYWQMGFNSVFKGLMSALDGSEYLTSCPNCFTPMKAPQYPLNIRLGGPYSQSA